jgi:hypothetical protein
MTQPPHTGPSAPPSTDFGAGDGARRSSSTDAATPWSSSAPPPPGQSSPWSSGTTSGGSGQPSAEPNFTSTPITPAPAEATTATVPLVQGTRSPVEGAAKRPNAGAGTHSAPRGARTTRARGPRRARLQLRHIDPWTVLKFACVLSIALFFVWLIVVGVLYGVLDGAGVIDKINETVTTINGGNAKPPITAGIVFGGAAIIGVVNIVLFIALSTVGSVVYNLCADLVGGIEVTLSER